MIHKDILEVLVPEKYLKCNILNPYDDLLVGAIRCLREQGKLCEFLGFNIWNGHVILIDGIKYYTGEGSFSYEDFPYQTFYVVEDEDFDYRENRFKERENQILNILKDLR